MSSRAKRKRLWREKQKPLRVLDLSDPVDLQIAQRVWKQWMKEHGVDLDGEHLLPRVAAAKLAIVECFHRWGYIRPQDMERVLDFEREPRW